MAVFHQKRVFETEGTDFQRRTAGLHRLSVFPVPQLSPETAAALQKIFQTSGFTSSSKGDSPDESPALTILNRLFVHAEAVTVDEAARVLSPLKPDELIHSGLLHQDGNLVQSLLQAQSYQGLIFFSDFRLSRTCRRLGPAGRPVRETPGGDNHPQAGSICTRPRLRLRPPIPAHSTALHPGHGDRHQPPGAGHDTPECGPERGVQY